MSVAVSRQPSTVSFSSPAHSRQMSARPMQNVPGIIRLQGGTGTKGSLAPPRTSRPRQRKPRPVSHDGAKVAPTAVVESSPTSDPSPPNKAAVPQPPIEHSSPTLQRRQQQNGTAKQSTPTKKQHQSKSSVSNAVHAPTPAMATPNSNQSLPRRRTQQPHQREQKLHDLMGDMSLSSADDDADSDDALAPSAPFSVAEQVSPRPARASRNNRRHNKNTSTVAGAVSAHSLVADAPTSVNLPAASIPISTPPRPGPPGRGRTHGHARAATAHSIDPFLSRSVPSSIDHAHGHGLPDWDMPPSFGITQQGPSSITSPAATAIMHTSMPDLHHHLAAAASPSRPVPRQSKSTVSEERLLVPWIETLEDAEERNAAKGASNSLSSTVGKLARTHVPGIGAPQTPTRPARRHARTSSVPSMSMMNSPPHNMYGPPTTPPYGGPHTPGSASNDRVNKYAGGRFQSAPAPTFIPMPSFQL